MYGCAAIAAVLRIAESQPKCISTKAPIADGISMPSNPPNDSGQRLPLVPL